MNKGMDWALGHHQISTRSRDCLAKLAAASKVATCVRAEVNLGELQAILGLAGVELYKG